MKELLKNRFLIVSVAFLTFAFVTGGVYQNGSKKFSDANSAATVLTGEKAIEKLKRRGEYDSLTAATTAARYSVERRDGKLHAPNPANKMQAIFDGEGNFQLQSSRKNLAWQTDWRLKSVGYGAEQSLISPGVLHSFENRIELRRDDIGLIEYFENQPDGLEQGFILNRKIDGANADKPLQIVLETSGNLQAKASADGQAVEMFDAGGAKVLSYEKLKV